MSSKNSLGKMKFGGRQKKYTAPFVDATRLRFAPAHVKNPALPFFVKTRRAGGR